MVTIQNNHIKATIKIKGAELSSLINQHTNTEFMWQGDPAFWGKHSPVLFPIVGALKANEFYYSNQLYSLPRHGFARDMEFKVVEKSENRVQFLLEDSAETRQKFPFRFSFFITYEVTNYTLKVTYRVENPATEPLFFSVGAHPAFRIPLVNGATYSDYALEFNRQEDLERWPITADGLIEKKPLLIAANTHRLALSKPLFYGDALVFKHLKSDKITLKRGDQDAGLDVDFPGFPYLGIWAAKDADFVCIEPWCGIADSVDTSQQFRDKEGINELAGETYFEKYWAVTVSI